MPQWKKPKPPYAVEVPPMYADTPYDDLPDNVQAKLDVLRVDVDAVVPEPQPDVLHPTPELEPSAHHQARDEDAEKDAKADAKADSKAKASK